MARDRDGSVYGELTYYIVVPTSSSSSSLSSSSYHQDVGSPPFNIDPKTGSLTTSKILDREHSGGGESVYHLVIGASDRGVPPLSGTVNVTIYVTDENDNKPVFVFPTASNRTVQVSARAPVNHVITRLLAYDNDVGRNARISFSINATKSVEATEGDDDQEGAFFDIDAERGVVIVNRALSEADGRSFELHVSASDHGTSPQIAHETLLVVVNRSVNILIFVSFLLQMFSSNFI